jgi:hypothetical protein
VGRSQFLVSGPHLRMLRYLLPARLVFMQRRPSTCHGVNTRIYTLHVYVHSILWKPTHLMCLQTPCPLLPRPSIALPQYFNTARSFRHVEGTTCPRGETIERELSENDEILWSRPFPFHIIRFCLALLHFTPNLSKSLRPCCPRGLVRQTRGYYMKDRCAG